MTVSVLANIDVDDLARATQFYCSALGLHVGRRFADSGIELLGGSTPIYLLKNAAGTVASPAAATRRDYTRHWTPVHLDFVVADLSAALARARSAGASLEGAIRTGATSR